MPTDISSKRLLPSSEARKNQDSIVWAETNESVLQDTKVRGLVTIRTRRKPWHHFAKQAVALEQVSGGWMLSPASRGMPAPHRSFAGQHLDGFGKRLPYQPLHPAKVRHG